MGVVITQSRTGIVVATLMIAVVLGRSRTTATPKLVLYALLAGAATLVVASGIATGVSERFQDDTGSTGARVHAVEFFADTWQGYALVGGGFTSSYRVASGGGLETSLESSFLMYAVDIGLVFALVYFGAQALIVLRGTRGGGIPGLLLSGVVVVTLPHTFSGLAAGNATGALLWTVLAMIVAAHDSAPTPDAASPGRVARHPVERESVGAGSGGGAGPAVATDLDR
jgi:hypothetical protein